MDNGLNKRKPIAITVFTCIPIFVFTLSIMIARTHVGHMPMSQFFWTTLTDESELADTYCYYKHIIIYCAAILAVLAAIVNKAFKADVSKTKKAIFYIPCFVYSSFAIISYLFSDYKYFALHGMDKHYQGILILLSYMVLLIFTYNSINTEKMAKAVIYVGLFAALLLGILGLTQALGHDFFQTVAGQKLITPNIKTSSGLTTWETIDMLHKFGESAYDYRFTKGEVYQTVFNINFVPFYLTLLIPIAAMLSIRFMVNSDMHYIMAIVFMLLFGLYLYNFFAANSASGYFGLLAIVLFGIIFFHKSIFKWIKPLMCLIIIAAIVMGSLHERWLPEVKSKLISNKQVLIQALIDNVYGADLPEHFSNKFDNSPASIKPTIDFIITTKKQMAFSINGESITITRNDAEEKFDITDQNGDLIVLGVKPSSPDIYELLDERFHDYAYLKFEELNDNKLISVITLNRKWVFKYRNDEFFYINPFGNDTTLSVIEHKGFEGNYNFGSARGAIWATTIPLLKNYLIKGFGPDCYTIAYPQNDYVFAYNNNLEIGDTMIVDKAHNIYLQMWVETGLISLIAWLSIVACYIIGAIKYMAKHKFVDTLDYINGGILLGIIGFMATAFFNDGSVNTLPMFYTMLGTGFAINNRDNWESTPQALAESESADMPIL